MGKAIDIHFNKNGQRTQSIEDMEKIRDKVIIPHMGGQLRWGKMISFQWNLQGKHIKRIYCYNLDTFGC